MSLGRKPVSLRVQSLWLGHKLQLCRKQEKCYEKVRERERKKKKREKERWLQRKDCDEDPPSFPSTYISLHELTARLSAAQARESIYSVAECGVFTVH